MGLQRRSSGYRGSGGGSAAPVPTLLSSIFGASLQDPNNLDAGNTGFSGGTFRFDLVSTGGINDGLRDGPAAFVFDASNLGWNPDRGDTLVLTVGSPEWASTSGNRQGCAIAVCDTATLGGSTNGVGISWYHNLQDEFAIQTTLSASSANVTVSSVTHLQARFRRAPDPSGARVEVQRYYSTDDGVTWKYASGSASAAVDDADLRVAVQGIRTNTPGDVMDVSFNLYHHLLIGAGNDYSAHT